MSATPEAVEEELTPEQKKDRQDAYKEAATQLGTAIAMGFVPYLGQAIDLYDTIWALIDLAGAETSEQKDDARFDTILAIVGWVPGPGDGVKKSLRIVNKNPDRYAPVLFDLLREVLQICGIKTSPEELLDKIFNEARIKASLEEIQTSIKNSDLFKELPESLQQTTMNSLDWTQANAGLMIGVVQRRITKWKRRKPNSSAKAQTAGRKRTDEPDKKKADTGADGHDRPKDGGAMQSVKGQIATASAELLDNALTGIVGEHIADYHCYETFKWGSGWDGHDKGDAGQWANKPGKTVQGKLSKQTKLFKLSLTANGTGIDAVWRADSHNDGKPYAIVEAKSSAAQAKPTTRPVKPGRKPGITGKLGVSNLPPKPEDLLEPAIEEDGTGKAGGGKAGGGKGGGGKKGGGKATSGASTSGKGRRKKLDPGGPIVQMSHEWIDKNIRKAVEKWVYLEIRRLGKASYSRHLFYIPIITPSAAQHAQALISGTADNPSTHTDHKAQFHYDEAEVKAAVNKKKTALRSKNGNLPNLKHEP